MYRKTRPTRYSFATFLLRIHGRYERTSYLTSLPIAAFMVLRQSASSQESTGCFFDWSLLAVPVILKEYSRRNCKSEPDSQTDHIQ